MGIFFGILLIAFGISCIRWNYTVANNLRSLQILGSLGGGDVYTGTKVLGIIALFVGLTLIFGLWQAVLEWIFSSFTNLI